MKELMIDLETLSTEDNAVVLSIGAVFFDPIFGRLGKEFYITLPVDEQLKLGRNISAETLLWWSKQERTTFADALKNESKQPLEERLRTFRNWIYDHADMNAVVWGNGSTFDITILGGLIKAVNLDVPWQYNKVMDLRTFARFVAEGEKVNRLGTTHHNALDDAKAQALYVIEHLQRST